MKILLLIIYAAGLSIVNIGGGGTSGATYYPVSKEIVSSASEASIKYAEVLLEDKYCKAQLYEVNIISGTITQLEIPEINQEKDKTEFVYEGDYIISPYR